MTIVSIIIPVFNTKCLIVKKDVKTSNNTSYKRTEEK